MPRVPSVLSNTVAKPSKSALVEPLVSMPSVPYAAARGKVPAEWSWTTAPTAPTRHTTATFAPMGYESGYHYPLIVWLHGDACDEHSLPEVMQHVSLRNFVATAPRGITELPTGYAWDQSVEAIDAAEESVSDAIQLASEQFSIHPQRVFIAGAGSGGTMAMRIALRRPEWFSGAATLDGPLPAGHQPLRRVNDLRDLPLLLSSSRQSTAYTEQQVCSDLSLLHSAGCCVSVRQYPGDTDLSTSMLADLNRWAMEVVCD